MHSKLYLYLVNTQIMKKRFLSLLIFSLLFISCNDCSESDTKEDQNKNIGLANLAALDMNEFSLVPYGLNLTILLPEVESSAGTSILPEVIHEDGHYLWQLNIGKQFNLVIEDFGKEKNKVTKEKEYLIGKSDIFKYEYIIDEPEIIMYKRELHKDQGGEKSYHCYGEMEVEGYTIILRTTESGGFRAVVLDMISSIKSAKAIVTP